jgi:hypothetical protein
MNITKNISVDFPGGVCNVIQFRIEIAGAINKFDTLEQTGDEITMHFISTLSNDEIDTINNIITNHVSDVSYNKTVTPPVIISPSSINSTFFTTWTTIMFFIFGGTLKVGIPQDVEIVSLVQDTVASGSFRIIDRSNANTIIEYHNITNKTAQLIALGPGINWPKNEQILEVQMKQSGSTNDQKIFLYEIKIEFNIHD